MPKVVLEACHGWYWAADTLAELGAAVHLANPLGRVKTNETPRTWPIPSKWVLRVA